MEKREFTAIYKKEGRSYVGWVEEVPGVNTQGNTKKEVKENLKEALGLILRVNKSISRKNLGKIFEREILRVPLSV